MKGKNYWVVEVDSKNKDLHAGINLTPGEYFIIPEHKEYKTGANTTDKFMGHGVDTPGSDLGVAVDKCKVGSLLWAIFNTTNNPPTAAQVNTAKQESPIPFKINHNADMYFKIVDYMNGYGDNEGKINVLVVKK
jgi:hypothetical protein